MAVLVNTTGLNVPSDDRFTEPPFKRQRLCHDLKDEVLQSGGSLFSSASNPEWRLRVSDCQNEIIMNPKGAQTPNVNDRLPRTGFDDSKRWRCQHEGCHAAFDRPSKLEIHERSHSDERRYVCTEAGCDRKFKKQDGLNRHIRDIHLQNEKATCTWMVTGPTGAKSACGKVFHNPGKLRRHVQIHEAKKGLECTECGQMFRKQETLEAHIRGEHQGETPYVCEQLVLDEDGTERKCGKVFEWSSGLKTHEKRDHYGYNCHICLMMDDDVQSSILDGSAISETNASSEKLMTYAELKCHIRTAHPPQCPDCGKQLKSVRGLKSHQRLEHSGVDPQILKQKYPCTWPGCGKRFTNRTNVETHMRNVHEKIKKFVCGEFDVSKTVKLAAWDGNGCGLGLATKAALERHVATMHLGIPGKVYHGKRLKARPETLETDVVPSHQITNADASEEHAGVRALAMLTGHGYEVAKHIPCLVQSCVLRFSHDRDLVYHVEMTHGWNIDDVNDAIFERDALAGGDFWIGGVDPAAEERSKKSREAARLESELQVRAHIESQFESSGFVLDMEQDAPGFPATRASDNNIAVDPSLV